jgi:hypothetical protein
MNAARTGSWSPADTRHLQRTRSIRALILIGTLLNACDRQTKDVKVSTSAGGEPTSSVLMAQPQSAQTSLANILDEGEPELRRGYGVVDMRFDECVRAQGDQALRGDACSNGFLIYGPYVNVPANSELEVTFDVLSSQTIDVYADIVSQMGKQSLAGLNPQTIEAGAPRRLGYRVNIFKPDQFVESRIGFRSPTPIGFAITNYTMTVR